MNSSESPFRHVDDRVTGSPLSPEGERRRLAMREQLTRVVRRRRVARLAGRGLVAAVLIVLVAIAFDAAFSSRTGDSPASSPAGDPITIDRRGPPEATESSVVRRSHAIVENRPGILERYRADPSPAVSIDEVLIDDAGLQELLRAAHRPTGIVRVGHRAVLASNLAALARASPTDATPESRSPGGRAN